eukprot:Skav210540  [mRNA]  locus=scaffold3045:417603:422174:- [translate_table: standard]
MSRFSRSIRKETVDLVKRLDGSRLVNATGLIWGPMGCGRVCEQCELGVVILGTFGWQKLLVIRSAASVAMWKGIFDGNHFVSQEKATGSLEPLLSGLWGAHAPMDRRHLLQAVSKSELCACRLCLSLLTVITCYYMFIGGCSGAQAVVPLVDFLGGQSDRIAPEWGPCWMERCFSGPVLCAAPAWSAPYPYISHSYVDRAPWAAPWVPLSSPKFVAVLCLLRTCRTCRLQRGRGTCLRAEELSVAEVAEPLEPTWLDKMRRACCLRRFDVVARIALSLKDMETAMEMIHALAFECLKHHSYFLKGVLKEFRLQNVSPELGLELIRNTELWFWGQRPNVVQVNELLYALVLAGQYDEAWDMLISMEDGSDPRLPAPTCATYGILLTTVAPTSDRAAAQLLTRYLISYFYTTLMAGYRRLGRKQDCFTLLGVMQQHAVLPSATVFSVLQQACWGHLDATGEVRQILRLMEDMNVPPETSNYNALIRTYGDAGLFTNALQVANRLREAGVPWNDFTYTYLIFAAVNAGQVELAVRLLSQMRSDGVRPTSKQYITVFLGLAQAGYYEDAKRVFKRIHCRQGCMSAAVETMEEMEEAGMGPASW